MSFLNDPPKMVHRSTKLEARIATRDYASDFYGRLNKMSDTERHIYINKVIEVAFRMKGLNYDLV